MSTEIDVLLPFHAAAPGLDAAIRSIIVQTYGHWRLILIDNKAHETAKQVAQRWAQEDARIIIIHEKEQGIAHALNTGLGAVTAPLVARMDADDICHPERFQEQVQMLMGDSTLGAVSCLTHLTSEVANHAGLQHFVNWQNGIITPEEHVLNRFVESPVAHPTMMFRAELIDRYGPYCTTPAPEDYELWLRWMANGVRMAKVPRPLLTWHDHPDRLTRLHPHYNEERMFEVKGHYLGQWIRGHLPDTRPVTVCGSSRWSDLRAQKLHEVGVRIDYCTDVIGPRNSRFAFITPEVAIQSGHFLINLIAQHGVRERMRQHFMAQGLVEGKDFLMAA